MYWKYATCRTVTKLHIKSRTNIKDTLEYSLSAMRILTWTSIAYEKKKTNIIYIYENIDTGAVRIMRKQKYLGYY